MSINGALAPAAAVVAVDVGKATASVLITDAARQRLLGPLDFPMTAVGVDSVIARARAVVPAGVTRVGVEAAGRYHRPLATSTVWPGWEVVELNPAHVTEQRRVMGRRRVKTDALDLEAMTELLLAGRGVRVDHGVPVLGELTAWAGHRRRRVLTRTATKNQLLGQLDRCFPGLTLALPDVLGTKVGRLVAEHFTDPRRLAALGPARFVRFAAARGLQVRRPVAERLVAAARNVLPSPDASVAGRSWLRTWCCSPASTARCRLRKPGSGSCCRSARSRRCSPSPAGVWFGQAATAPRSATRTGGPAPGSSTAPPGCLPCSTNRPGSAATASSAAKAASSCGGRLIDLGIGLWLTNPAAKRYGQQLRARGKKGGDRLRHGAPGQQARLRPGPRPDRLRPDPLGLTTPRRLPRSRPTCRSAGPVNLERPQRSEDERG